MIKLAVVEKIDGELHIIKGVGFEDLKLHHPKCNECGYRKGIHGFEGDTSVFCQVWNKPVKKDDYCSNYKL